MPRWGSRVRTPSFALRGRGGGTGRRTGLKILRRVTFVPVRFRSSAEFHIKHPWLNWIEYLTTNQAVAGSNPAGCIFREVAQLGRALGLGPRGRRFESCLPDLIFFGGVAQLARASGSYPGGRGFDPLRRYYFYGLTLDL